MAGKAVVLGIIMGKISGEINKMPVSDLCLLCCYPYFKLRWWALSGGRLDFRRVNYSVAERGSFCRLERVLPVVIEIGRPYVGSMRKR